MRILITGAYGQLGRDLADALAGRVPDGGVRCALLGPEGRREGLRHDVLGTDIDTMPVDDRDAVLARGKVGETYHVGSGVEASIMEVADRILAALGKPESLKTIVPDRPGHDRRYVLDNSKLRRELGWAPSVEWEQGLADTVAWYAAHRDWWEPLMARAPVAEGAWGAGAG